MHQGRVVYGAIEEVVFGHPAAEAIVAQMDRLGTRRAFLMVSGTLNRQTDEIAKIVQALGPRRGGLFDAMPAHTPREAVIAATNAAREARADLIVTVGGGSITDGAKAVQLCLANGIDEIGGIDRIRVHKGVAPEMTAPTVRQISVPTTIAGGEFSSIAGVTDRSTHVKQMLRHPLTVPRATILDPAITVHTPEWLFLSTGVRAIDHCVEAICSRETHPYADAQSVKGLAMLADALPRVKAGPADLDARMDAQIGLMAVDGRACGRRADGGEPRHRLCAGCGLRRAARLHLLHHAAGGDALECERQCRTPDDRRRRHGFSRPRCRRRARCLYPLARHAAQPRRCPRLAGTFRRYRRTGNAHELDPA